jgi:hypothetical protein
MYTQNQLAEPPRPNAPQERNRKGDPMKEQENRQVSRILVIDINLTRPTVVLLVLAASVVALLGYLVWGHRQATASADAFPQAGPSGLRQYYLSDSFVLGADADTSCAAGYHMASLWEILDPSNLEYNTEHGLTKADSGEGPPTDSELGWVRTGYVSDDSNEPGLGNCNTWSTSSGSSYGTCAGLSEGWEPLSPDVGVWNVSFFPCDLDFARVWCVED